MGNFHHTANPIRRVQLFKPHSTWLGMTVLKRWVYFYFLDYFTTFLRFPTFDRIKRSAFLMPDKCGEKNFWRDMVSF
jgi:hypothetical protein